MIELKNIYKSFGGKEILNDINAVMQTGMTNLIIGTSGSGKTVLQKCMVGLFEVDKGEIVFDGNNLTSMSQEERKELRQQIGMLFQGGALFDSLTVEQNVTFPLSMFTNLSIAEKRDRANFCLQRVNLENVNKLLPSAISGGMKKRVAIARAIAMNPKYLFCDEPNSGLDPKTSILIDELIKEITEEFNITTIINTHDMNTVMSIGEKILFIYKGKKFWEGSNDDIMKSDNQELNDFVFASRWMKAMKKHY